MSKELKVQYLQAIQDANTDLAASILKRIKAIPGMDNLIA